MTYKEIRALIEKRRKDWRYGNSVEAKYKAEECKDILELIDSLQEEPKFKVGDIIKHKHYEHWETEEVIEVTAQGVRTNIGWLSFPDEWELVEEPKKKEPVSGNIDFEQELYKAFGQVKDFTLGIAIAKRFYDMGKNNGKEPISDELEEAAVEWFNSVKYKSDLSGTLINAFKAGAQWQKEQFEKNRLKHCDRITNEQAELEQGFVDQHLDKHNRIPTFLDAIEYGMNLQKEQIMENATEAIVAVDAGGYPYIPQIELYDYDKDVPLAKEGDKYKVILIKENKNE